MKLSNFKMEKVIGENPSDLEYFASVDVTTGWWIFRKTTSHLIYKKHLFWKFLETMEFTPGFQAERLSSSYAAQEKFKETA